MEIILTAIAAGGLVGASDQYLCLLIIAIASKTGLVQLAGPMGFLSSWWFIGFSALFWLVSIAPAYASLLTPGIMNAVNTIHKFLSGFLVPLSSALVALAAVGVITSLNPELQKVLDSLKIFNPEGGIGATGWAVSGASAMVGLSVTGMKALTKPMISSATGTTGHLAAPIFVTIENLMAIILMVVAYLLTAIDPWLLIALLGVVVFIILAGFIAAIYQMWRLKKGLVKCFTLHKRNRKPVWQSWLNFSCGVLAGWHGKVGVEVC